MEIIMSIGAKISEYTVEPIGRQVGYLFYYKSNAENLITEIQKLKYVKDRLQHSIDEAKNNGEEIEANVLHWLSRVVRMISQHTDSFVRNEGQANMRCLSGQFPDLGSQYRMSRKAKKMAVEVGIAIQAAGGFNKVSYLPVLQSIFEVKGYVAFQSRMSTLKRIMEALRNPNFNTIGVYGMGGVGKTMLCKEVAKQAKGQLLFSKVVVVTISQTRNLENIQQEVAEKLGLNLNEKSIPVRADRLRHRLRQEKKILVILDDIWEKLELQDIGISFGDDKNECKILLTSRSRDVLCNDMVVEQNFLVGVLSVSEATNLFNTIVADAIKNPSIQPVAIEIVKECAGLPIAIATVANALKNKSLPVWNNALQELRISTPTNIKGMHEKVYSSIKLSYDSLRSTEAKSLLLLCSLFHEDANIDIEHLLRQGTGWGLFKGITKLEDARNKVVTLVEDLKICCLLLDGDYGCCVKMHDVIRDVTISIASRDRHLHNFGSVAELEECITDIDFRKSTAISLSVTDQNCHLPERWEFPKVKLFCMSNRISRSRPFQNLFIRFSDGVPYHRDLTIPNHFFEEMKELRVLELINICLRPLPSSFRFFENLQTLCLWYCDIGEVAIIGELKNLKILDLSGSNIKELPKEIGHLTHLRLLDLKYCSKLKVIRPNIISCFTSLQELNMDGTFIDWKVNDDSGERSNASLVELKNLHQLTALHLQIPDASILPKEFFSEKLERYDLIIGNAHARFVVFGFEISKRLYLKLNKRDIFNLLGLEILLKKSEMLFLNGLEGLNSVVRELDGEGFPQLKHLHFENNGGTQYIVNSMEEAHACSAFVSLDILHLKRLMNLEKIYHGKLTEKCFGKLRVIKVDSCDKLKNLFSFSMARGLLQLEEIAVTSCKMMEKIILYETEDDSRNMSYETIQKIPFPQLRTLTLCSLPNLMHFLSQVETNCQRQRKDEQQIADFSMSFFNEKVTFPKLKTLKLERSALLKELWHDQSKGLHGDEEPLFIFSGLRELTLSELANLMHIWDDSYPIDRAFLNLMILQVLKCDKLKNLAPSWISFQNLIILRVSNCHGMVSLLNSSTSKSMTQLRLMVITGCKSMTEIIADKGSESGGEIIFNQLLGFEVRSLPSLTSFYSGSFMMAFPKLKYVGISHCPEMRCLSRRVVSTPQLKNLTLLDEVWEDEGYSFGDDFEWLDRDSTELDFDELTLSDDEVDNDHEQIQELIEGDINTTIRHLWEKDQVGLALQQLFAE